MLRYIKLREMPELKTSAAEWFHSKWGVPQEAYWECMEAYLFVGNRIISLLACEAERT